MSCPMNCPKNLRNGPCGGVRENGHCEVKPEMKCVWVQAWEGAEPYAQGHRHPRCAEARRQPPEGPFLLAAGRAREDRAAAAARAARRKRLPRSRRHCDATGSRERRHDPADLYRSRRSPAAAAGPQLPRPAGARAARGQVRRHLRAEPAGFRRSAGGLRPRSRPLRGLRRHQRHRCLRRQCAYVERRHLQPADPGGLCRGHADLLPRPQPHRHPGRCAGRGRHGGGQHPLPHGRRRAGGRPAPGEAGLRSRQQLAAGDHPRHARQEDVPLRAQDHHAAAGLPGGGGQSLHPAL